MPQVLQCPGEWAAIVVVVRQISDEPDNGIARIAVGIWFHHHPPRSSYA